jgi:osmoprotectant transport system permease protein
MTGRGFRALRAGGALPFLVALLLALTFGMTSLQPLFHAWFPELQRPVYTRASFPTLLLAHAGLVGAASLLFVLLGVATGIAVTRPWGRAFAGMVQALTAIGQTFPPAAVLAIAVPLLGYGVAPTLIALVAYGVLPVVETTIRGLEGVPRDIQEAAEGAGFTRTGRLWRIEMPLAAPVILSGIRTSVIIAIGTATIGSTVGALTLGSPIIEGLSGSNPAYVLQGAVVVGLFAVCVDIAFERLDRALRPARRDQS